MAMSPVQNVAKKLVFLVGKMLLDPVGVCCGTLGVLSCHMGPTSIFLDFLACFKESPTNKHCCSDGTRLFLTVLMLNVLI